MSRMRLMQADGANVLECLYCGSRADGIALVVYCDCRHARKDGPAVSARTPRPLARTA